MKKVALITGASAGIGKEFAKIHAEKGGDLIIVARRKDKLQTLKEEIEKKYSNQVKIIAMDLSLADSPQKIYDIVKNEGIEVEYFS